MSGPIGMPLPETRRSPWPRVYRLITTGDAASSLRIGVRLFLERQPATPEKKTHVSLIRRFVAAKHRAKRGEFEPPPAATRLRSPENKCSWPRKS